jgi:hypothetical protein
MGWAQRIHPSTFDVEPSMFDVQMPHTGNLQNHLLRKSATRLPGATQQSHRIPIILRYPKSKSPSKSKSKSSSQTFSISIPISISISPFKYDRPAPAPQRF